MAYLQLLKRIIILVVLHLCVRETRTDKLNGFSKSSDTCNVPNGICVTSCTCKEGFIPMEESCLGKVGTNCSMKSERKSDCIPQAACVDSLGGGRCTCNDGFVASSNNTECRVKVGRPCNVTAAPYCIQNAECDVTGDPQSTCTCSQGYSAINDNTECLGNAGTTCAVISDCIQNAVCTENTCTCEELHAPSEDKTKCIGYVGAICDKQSGTCVANASCIDGQCACVNDFQVDGYGGKTCKAKVGTDCAATRDCILHAYCTGYTCACEDSYTSSADRATCIGNVGATCDQNSDNCVANAACINGHCACKNGYQADGNDGKTCKEKDAGLKDSTWIYIGSVAGFLLVLAAVTCTVTHYCFRKKLQNCC